MKQLLILDDDVQAREEWREKFRARGYEVRVHGAVQAWDAAAVFQPSHALVGLEWGWDALATLKRKYPSCVIVMLAECGSIAAAVRAMKCGAADYLCKPARIEDIERAFREAATPVAQLFPRSQLHEVERDYIQKILQDLDGNISQAARVLGIHRQSLQRKLRKLT